MSRNVTVCRDLADGTGEALVLLTCLLLHFDSRPMDRLSNVNSGNPYGAYMAF